MEIRISNGKAEISGYVNAVGRDSRVLRDASGAFIEQVEPGTFARAIDRADSVGLMFNHQRALDSTDFTLEEDNIGLKARATVTDAEVIRAAQEHRLTGWSFGFTTLKDEWRTAEDGMRHRTLQDIDLAEVSILTKVPAYIATSIECRGDDSILVEHRYTDEQPDVEEVNAAPSAGEETAAEVDEPPAEAVPVRTFDAYKALSKYI